MINNYGSINLTKLDVLDDLDEIKLGVSYSINGQVLKPGQMPSTIEDLAKVEVLSPACASAASDRVVSR